MSGVAPTIGTARLILRAPALEDFEPYANMWADARVTTYIGGTPRPRDVSWVRFVQMIGFWPLLGYGYWVLEDRETGALAGVGGLGRFERGIKELDGFPEAGWALAAQHWGRGLASEAVAAILAWCDETLDTEVRCLIDASNGASISIAKKSSFARIDDTRVYARRASGYAPAGSDPSKATSS
jgi:RimJ/RimL family protein N-acetyltransferase